MCKGTGYVLLLAGAVSTVRKMGLGGQVRVTITV